MNRVLALAFALSIASPAHAARGLIEGTVIDRNGDPVAQAIVQLEPGEVQLVTDRDGHFSIDYLRDRAGERTRLLPRMTYTLEVFRPGFHVYLSEVDYVRGALDVGVITLVEDTIAVRDDGVNLDPGAYTTTTSATGANYEGQ